MKLPQFITNIKNDFFLYYKHSKMFWFKYATDIHRYIKLKILLTAIKKYTFLTCFYE